MMEFMGPPDEELFMMMRHLPMELDHFLDAALPVDSRASEAAKPRPRRASGVADGGEGKPK